MKNSKPKTRHKQNLVDKAVQYLTREILADRLRPNQRISELAVPPTLPIEGLKPIRAAEAAVAAMREAVGDAIDIMVDCHARPSP